MIKRDILFFLMVMLSVNILSFATGKVKVPADRWGLGRWDQIENFRKKLHKSVFGGRNLPFVTGAETALAKVYRDKYWFKGDITDTINMSSAKNEYESFQLAIVPTKDNPLAGIKIGFSDLVEEKTRAVIEKSNIKFWIVEYVKTVKSIHPTFIGEWPDPLVDFKPFDLGKDELKAIWVELYVPESAKPGVYNGHISISGDHSPGLDFKIKLNVWEFTLPKKQVFRTCTWVSPGSLSSRYGKKSELDMFRKYCEYFLNHKINPLNVGKSYYNKNDYSTVDSNIDFALRYGLSVFEIPRLQGDELINFCNHLKEKGWFNKAMIYGYKDEPAEEDYPAFRKDSERIHEAVPDLKLFIAESPHPGLYGAVDVWWACMADENSQYNRERLSCGEEVWWYRCGIPVRCEFNRPYSEYPSDVLIDRPSIDMRILYWMAWKFKMTPATFFWCGFWTEIIPKDWPDDNLIVLPEDGSKLYSGTRNGDGWVVYPGKKGPLPSMRLKCMRDGIEDYEYLWLLNNELDELMKKPRRHRDLIEETKNILSISNELIVDTNYYSKDPLKLLQYRDKVAKQILKLRREER